METLIIVLFIIIIILFVAFIYIFISQNTRISEQINTKLLENSESIRNKVDEKLDITSRNMANQLESSRLMVTDITRSLTKLEDTNKRVIDTQQELKTLQSVLTNNKSRGNLGEYYLEDILGNVLPPTIWQRQYSFDKQGIIADSIIKLKDGKLLAIDSKFSMQNYEKMTNSENKIDRENYAKALKNDLKKRIDETSKYILPEEGTMDFAFMFIPSEALYYDAIVNDVGEKGSSRNLIDYAFNDRKVIIVSPTTLMAYLQTVMQGLRSLQIEESAKEIKERVSALGRHIEKYEEYMGKLGSSLGTTVNHFNVAHKELEKIDKDIVKISDQESVVSPLVIDKPQNET